MNTPTEAKYPITFRATEAKLLGQHLKNHSSVVMIGMKRVGISNFLRFFLNHPGIPETYVKNGMPTLCVSVDLNDLVEREIFPFWTLFLKRLVDTIDATKMSEKARAEAHKLFTESIQLKDLFFTVDCVQKVLKLIIEAKYYPVVFLLRFDRMKDAATPEFLHNLQGLKDAVSQKLSYVFTSYRPLSQVNPTAFPKSALSVFTHDMYLPPATAEDMRIIGKSFQDLYELHLPKDTFETLIRLSGGHVHYLQLMLLKLRESTMNSTSEKVLLESFLKDEEILLQSEELFEGLTKVEQEVLVKIAKSEKAAEADIKQATYLWDTGISNTVQVIFSALFERYISAVKHDDTAESDFTKKEHLLFSFLKTSEGNLCEREAIVEAVWPEQAETGVSDWAVDRLVARVRVKLKKQKSPYEIVTVITRGYKLMKKS